MGRKMIFAVFALILIAAPCIAQDAKEGEVDAMVSDHSGSGAIPADIEGKEVEDLRDMNGEVVPLSDAEIENTGEAVGTNPEGDSVKVELEDNPMEENEELNEELPVEKEL